MSQYMRMYSYTRVKLPKTLKHPHLPLSKRYTSHHLLFQNKTWKTDGLAKRLNLVEPPRAPYLAAGWTDTPNTNDVSWEVFFVDKKHQPSGVLEARSASLAPGPG
ncbi:hypothetical protein HDV62DRAFT_370570 [Trichoderma sp. SZMC 28011]